MGNYRFRFSDMIPNAWFYKLRDMNKTRHHPHPKSLNPTNKKHSSPSSSLSSSASSAKDHTPVSDKPHLSDNRKSYHFTRDLSVSDKPEPPRKSSTRRRSTKTNRRPPQPRSAGCTCTLESIWVKPDPNSNTSLSPSSSDLDSVLPEYGSGNDVVIDLIDENTLLPPIITKRSEAARDNLVNSGSPARRLAGVRLRTNSPRIINRRRRRRSVTESVAVVKTSRDPMRDFRESMVEMIVENDIRASKDLEELLACYLSLNSDEYHDLIVNVFKQIWFDFIHLRLLK